MQIITERIKSLLSVTSHRKAELAEYLGVDKQSLQNKFTRGSFTSDDLIQIAIFTGAELAFTANGNKIILDESCLRERVKKKAKRQYAE